PPGGEPIDGGEALVHVPIHEADLARARLEPGPRPGVSDPQKNDFDPHGLRRGPDPQGELVGSVVPPPFRGMVEVVELAHAGDPREGHLEEGDAGDRLHLLGAELEGRAVHLLPPAPEVVALAAGLPRLGPSTDRALEGVAVGVDEAGDEEPSRQAHHLRLGGRRSDPGNLLPLDGDGDPGPEPTLRPNPFRLEHEHLETSSPRRLRGERILAPAPRIGPRSQFEEEVLPVSARARRVSTIRAWKRCRWRSMASACAAMFSQANSLTCSWRAPSSSQSRTVLRLW